MFDRRPIHWGPDRQVLVAASLGALAAVLTLLLHLLQQLNVVPATNLVSWLEISGEIAMVALVWWGGPLALRVMKQRHQATIEATEARTQVEMLFQMTDILQSALGYPDANAVLQATSAKLLPGVGGALYVFNNSGDRLELSSSWSWPDEKPPAPLIAPTQCWALKRGKPHFNHAEPAALHCEHHNLGTEGFEIPMMARGEVYGLLKIHAAGPDARARLAASATVATALADAMSLALANIALREKLRTQALRDPLTGLYNRRYMEDVLERYSNLAERNESALSAVMIDLDHFKLLNDEHGHAVGDAVLRDVASVIVGAIRPSDVACRFGGEELLVLLPECGLDEALVKAELLRTRIERLSEAHGAKVSASLGVAAVPETSRAKDLVDDADAAMYRAKGAGRNRVASAAEAQIRPLDLEPPAAAAA